MVFPYFSCPDINISDIVVESCICLAFSSLVTADTAQFYVYLLLELVCSLCLKTVLLYDSTAFEQIISLDLA